MASVEHSLFRDAYGRMYSNMNLSYCLPGDAAEHDRLTRQHVMLSNYLGGLYAAQDIVEYVLRSGQDHTPTVLDVGAGSGAWTIDMAIKFPECKFLGMDIVPPELGDRVVPDNCSFEIGDANLAMPQWVGKFDLVHVRAIQTGIHDFESFLYNIAHIMRPGALLILSTGGTQVFDENDNPRRDVEEGEEGFTWTKKFFSAIAAAVYKDKPDASKLWDKWANSNPNLEQVVRWEMPMPIGNWNLPTSEEQRYANEINRWNILELFMTCAPILVKEGFSEDVIERWKKEVKK